MFSTTGYTYDSLNRLTDITNLSGSSAVVSKFHYVLRADGKRLSVTDASGTTDYTYDDSGKLTQEAGPYATIGYGYDNVGNRLTRTVTGSATALLPNGTTTNTYDLNDRIATVNGSATHSYDLDGNEQTVNGQAAGYDFENHLVSLGNGTASYVYDADGNRVSVSSAGTTTSYVVDTSLPYASVVEEYSGSALAARYDYGDDLVRMDRGSGVYYYLYDGLGSTRQLVSTSGTVTDSYGYSAFGEMAVHTGSTVNPFLFNAQQFDGASGDYYLRARYYDQSNGRFISQDPYSGSDDDPITLHRYLYASGDPVDRTDPGGQEDTLIGTSVASSITATLISVVGRGLIGAGIGAALGAGDAYLSGGNVADGATTGALYGFGTGILGAAGTPLLRAILFGVNVFGGTTGIGLALYDGNYGLASWRVLELICAIKLGNPNGQTARILNNQALESELVSPDAAADAGEAPTPRADDVILYRGTGTPEPTQVGMKYRANPSSAPSGAENFYDPNSDFDMLKTFTDGAGQGDPNSEAVSSSTNKATASLAGKYVVRYRVPRIVFDRLWAGTNPLQGEVIWRHSIPDAYRDGPIMPSK